MKKVAQLYLLNMGCHTVDSEVKLSRLGLDLYSELDNKQVIDVLGVQLQYRPYTGRKLLTEQTPGFNVTNPEKYLLGCNVLRGVEVKVSRGDYRSGFACTGCNYNYVFAPTRMLAPGELPDRVGLIEFNRYKFSCELNPEDGPDGRPFKIKGVRVVKRPRFQSVPRFYVDQAVAQIALRRVDGGGLFREVQEGLEVGELVYQAPS